MTEESKAKLEVWKKILENTPVTPGECRHYNQCRTCGQIVVREFIPFGLGSGQTWNACWCFVTHNDQKGYETLLKVDG